MLPGDMPANSKHMECENMEYEMSCRDGRIWQEWSISCGRDCVSRAKGLSVEMTRGIERKMLWKMGKNGREDVPEDMPNNSSRYARRWQTMP